jgi:chemotaxis protein CheC
VPNVAVHPISEITPILNKVITGIVATVNQTFGGPIAGNAILLLDHDAALLLNRLLTDRSDAEELDGAAKEVITEVGNIVLNACLGVFGNLLQVQVSFTVPDLRVDTIQDVLKWIKVDDAEIRYALMIHTRFYLRASDVSGYLVIILGVTSLERLLQELRKWEERQLT